ncbi:MAG: diguanylate cyclase, partial [Pseudomonadota bacterium]
MPESSTVPEFTSAKDNRRDVSVREPDALHQEMVDSTYELISLVDRNYCFLLVNLAYETRLGLDRESLIGTSIKEVVGDKIFSERTKPSLDRCFSGERVEVFGWTTFKKIGARFMRVSFSPCHDAHGGINSAVVCAIDLTEQRVAMDTLEESEEKYRQIFALESDAIVIVDGDTHKVSDFNDAALTTYGYSREEFLALSITDLSSETERSSSFLATLEEGSPGQKFDRLHKRADGTVFPVVGSMSCFRINNKRVYCYVGRDVTLDRRVEQDLYESSMRFRAIVEASPLPLVISRLSDGRIIYANDRADRDLQLSNESIVGTDIKKIFRNESQRIAILEEMRQHGSVSGIQISVRNNQQEKRWLSCTASLIEFLNEECVATGFIDVTESRELARQLSYQASHDPLTGLVNRREFEVRLKRAVSNAKRTNIAHALCFMDLDKFKLVNDTCGHQAGDALLRTLATTMRSSLRQRDTLARLGGDEFAVIIEHCGLSEATKVAESLRKAIQSQPFSWDGRHFEIGVSIGLVPIDNQCEDVMSLLKSADNACYAAKKSGKNCVQTFSQDDEGIRRQRAEVEWIGRVHEALREEQFCLYSHTAKAIWANPPEKPAYHEILVRLNGGEDGVVAPSEFLPIAERFNLASQIDRWVISKSFENFAQSPQCFENGDFWSINVSGQSIGDTAFCDYLVDLLDTSPLPLAQICFEITETAAINNLAEARTFLNTLRACG